MNNYDYKRINHLLNNDFKDGKISGFATIPKKVIAQKSEYKGELPPKISEENQSTKTTYTKKKQYMKDTLYISVFNKSSMIKFTLSLLMFVIRIVVTSLVICFILPKSDDPVNLILLMTLSITAIFSIAYEYQTISFNKKFNNALSKLGISADNAIYNYKQINLLLKNKYTSYIILNTGIIYSLAFLILDRVKTFLDVEAYEKGYISTYMIISLVYVLIVTGYKILVVLFEEKQLNDINSIITAQKENGGANE